MIEKLAKPIRFDKEVDVLVVARDGEKFYVTQDGAVSLDQPLSEMKVKPLLDWAMVANYPIQKFVRAQRVLSAKFFSP